MSGLDLFRRPRRAPNARELDQILQIWRGVWLIVSARGKDELTLEVERLGDAMKRAAASRDPAAILAAVTNAYAWLQTLAGTVTAMLTAPFRRLL